jgi:hypothetical protein
MAHVAADNGTQAKSTATQARELTELRSRQSHLVSEIEELRYFEHLPGKSKPR